MERHQDNRTNDNPAEHSPTKAEQRLAPQTRHEAQTLHTQEALHGEAFSAYLSCVQESITIDDAEEDFKARYRGSYSHLEAFAEDYTENLGWNSALEYFTHVEGIPAGLVAWDMPALLEVLESEYQIIEHGGGIHVFYK